MSYGRKPYYIYRTAMGFQCHESFIPYDLVAQLIASMAARNNGELQALVRRGMKLRKDTKFTPDFKVTVTGGFRRSSPND